MEELFMPTFLKPKRPQFPKDISLAMAYIPLQEEIEAYDSEKGLARGTIFPSLDKEFKGKFVAK